MFPMLNFRIIGACVCVRCTLQIRQWYDVNWISKIEERLLLGFRVAMRKEMLLWDLVSVRVSLADFGNGSKQQILFEIVHVREDPEALQTERTATSPIWLYVNAQPLHADYVTICGLRLELECLIKPYAIVWEPIIYAAVARLFDHHSYHVTERPDVIGARFICGGNVFSGVKWCSLMNPGLVSSSMTVGFVSTDVLGSASLTLTLDNVTGSVVAAPWCGVASLSTTGPPSMWWMAIWQESAISMRLSGRWFYQAFSRLEAGQFCRMTMPDPTAPGWWLTFSDNKVSPGWIGQHIRLTWPQ